LDEVAATYAQRSLLNVIGTAMGASRDEAVQRVVDKAEEHGGLGVASVPGRAKRLDLFAAALATGMAAHLRDSA